MRPLYVMLVVPVFAVFAGNPVGQARSTNTQRMDFADGGTLRIEHSIGMLSIEAWDRPEIEIDTTKSTRAYIDPKSSDKFKKELELVHIIAERHGSEVVLTTDFPRYGTFKPLMQGSPRVDIEYRIKVPRKTHLVIHQEFGSIYVDGVNADIEASVPHGDITVLLPSDSSPSIEASTKFGTINSFVSDEGKRYRWPLGRTLAHSSASGGQKCLLKAGTGDIAILRVQTTFAQVKP